ncbi:MAG: type I DNA topoisomerase [Deltaproteobacteria bacterium]|nr:MAG: type I DNA topoisomerase [Deltaproteobacteria bacterium]
MNKPAKQNLLIVESPAKAKTIQKYLGKGFQILASVGHVKDLPVNKLGVEVENNFAPEYVTIKGKGKILSALKKAGKNAQAVYLAPDPDREGEAIAWHIAQELENGKKPIFRVLFNELTERAIREAVASPGTINQDKFESQQARRILDRLVGYQISPLLWSRVKRGLSAGRVQSVALRLICDREREIQKFDPREYWSLTAHLSADEPPPFKARLSEYDGSKIELKNESETQKIMSEVSGKIFTIRTVAKKKKKRNPSPPFITSTLQQEAYRKLRFSAKKTMSVAQNLYEGVELGRKGQIGLITYMRTDSFRLSGEAVQEARGFIEKKFGPPYLPAKPNSFKSKKGAQEAHEAIRPTSVNRSPEEIAGYLNKDQLALYRLIWNRFVACQMSPALFDQTQADMEAGKAIFRASGSIKVFDGFTVLYEEGVNGVSKEKNSEDMILPPLKKGEKVALLELEPAQHFTQPPPRFTEATLIKALEERGIGRPSTYATILSNIRNRDYVYVEKRRFHPTELGLLVTDLLVMNFSDILDPAFTAQMEEKLDQIERGEIAWTKVLDEFYRAFGKDLEKAQREMKGEVVTSLTCPECKRSMAIKSGKNGLFLACTGYPECRYTANFTRDEKGDIVMEKPSHVQDGEETCEMCGRPMVVKRGKFGEFLACTGYPECKNTRNIGAKEESGLSQVFPEKKCILCGANMLIKRNKSGQRFLACERYPACKHTEPMSTGVPCPEEGCDGTLVEKVSRKGRVFYACDRYPDCRFVMWDEPYNATCPICGTSVLRIKRPQNGGPVLSCRKKGCDFRKPFEPVSDD